MWVCLKHKELDYAFARQGHVARGIVLHVRVVARVLFYILVNGELVDLHAGRVLGVHDVHVRSDEVSVVPHFHHGRFRDFFDLIRHCLHHQFTLSSLKLLV